MADQRIYELPITAGDLSTFVFIMDKSGELTAVKVPYTDIIGPLNDAISDLQNDKANETSVILKGEGTPYIPSSAGDPADKTYVDGGGSKLSWQNATKVSGLLTTPAFMRCCKIGPFTIITGIHELSSIPAEGTVLYQLPSSFPLFTETFYFGSIDAAIGREDESCELKALVGTRQIVMGGGGSNGTEQYFNAIIPVI